MGCCQGKNKENTVAGAQPQPEAASLKHPQADANKAKNDEEAQKKGESSPSKQPAPAETKKNEAAPPAQSSKKEVYGETSNHEAKGAGAEKRPAQESAPKPQAHGAGTGIQASPANPSPKKVESKPEHHGEVKASHHNEGQPKSNPVAAQPHAESKPAQGKPDAQKKSEKPFNLKEILDLFNDLRTNPSKYSDRVQILYLDHINDKNVNMRTKIMTNEGKGPYIEAKKFLATQAPLKKCELDDGLTAAAYLHSVYAAELGQLTHQGKGNSSTMDRIREFGDMSSGMCAENILDRREVTPEEWLLDFVIDDGVATRGHRKNIFNAQATKVGLGVARKNHQSDWFFTMDFASDGYKSDKSKIPANVLEASGLADFHRETGR